ncbi:MAG: triosephosphate isomerase [Bacilli bacterium]|nr:triosephosphate isomerase [Bacilli bacterium]
MKLVCCNFKMNLLKDDIENYIKVIHNYVDKNNLIIFPSIPYINDFKQNGFIVGSQNISFNEFGSITGDTSILQLKEMGITYTIIGHSERRKYFNDDIYIKEKINLALNNNVKVILCIGESIKTNEQETYAILKKEIDDAFLNNTNLIKNDNLIIAYEPIWSIGSGLIPDNTCLTNTINYIKDYVFNTYKVKIKVLYGGSVNISNIDSLQEINEIDGYLIGSFSLKPENILDLSTRIM